MRRHHDDDNALGTNVFFFFFPPAILAYNQSDDDPQEDFIQIWLQAKYESNLEKKHLRSEILANYFNHAYKSGGFFLIFFRILAIENL